MGYVFDWGFVVEWGYVYGLVVSDIVWGRVWVIGL